MHLVGFIIRKIGFIIKALECIVLLHIIEWKVKLYGCLLFPGITVT
jgi:hypothetical protein